MNRHSMYNRIAMLAAVLLIAFMGFFGVRGLFFHSLALEQEVRCGIPAHTHSAECYDGHRRVCGQAEHSHNRNCYILLLEDNDINDLLVQMAAHVDNSLEGVINETVNNALVYNTNLTSPLSSGTTLADVAALNSTVEQYNVSPAVVLNENMQTRAASNDTLGAALPTAPNGAQTLSADDSPLLSIDPVSDYGWANYYLLLDGEWTLVQTMPFDITAVTESFLFWSTTTYTASEAVADVLSLYNGFLHTNLTTSTASFYVTASPGQKANKAADIKNNAVIFEEKGGSAAEVKEARYVRLYNNRGNDMPFFSVTLEYPDGHTAVHYVASGGSFVLPALSDGSKWVDQNNTSSSHNGGTTIKNITAPRVFTAQSHAADTTLNINYSVNFPVNIGSVSVTTPTIKNSNSSTATVPLEKGNSHRILDVSSTEVTGRDQYSYGKSVSRMFRFTGWRVPGTDILLSPGASTDWSELSRYAGGRNTLNLVGTWEYNPWQTASFYIRYDSTAADNTGGTSSVQPGEYTNELFAAFIDGVDTTMSKAELSAAYGIQGSEENSYAPDQQIRAMYGNTGEGLSLTTFPSDEYIFQKLKEEEEGNITVEGNAVPVKDLNDKVYTIRWYVLKLEDKAWHVDGRLVKKEGILDITKTFAGNAAAIQAAKADFSITAKHDNSSKQYTLTLQNDPNLLKVSGDGNTYHWRIKGLTYGEPWTITENGTTPNNVLVHTDYRVVDTYGQGNDDRDAVGTGTTVSVDTTTISTDMDVWYPLTVNFTNIYHKTDSLIIKKEDFRTGNPLGGAVFQLQQRNKDTGQLQLLRFSYNKADNTYSCDPNGSLTQLTSATSGYYELNIGNFLYSDGNIVVQEVSPPYGYTEIADIEIGYYDPNARQAAPPTDPVTLEPASPTDLAVAAEFASPTDLAVAAEFASPTDIMPVATDGVIRLRSAVSDMVTFDNGLLIVRNKTSNISVTVQKRWGHDDIDPVSVTMHLYANGAPVTSILDKVQLEKVLSEGNWTATWENLPLYANGRKITWSVQEVKIGDEACLSDFTFVNWLVLPGAPVEHYTNGVLDNITFTITNDTHRTVLYVVKTNMDGTVRLEGASFTLQRLRNGVVDSTFSRTGVTNSAGTILFDNLEHGDYILTETKSPSGYEEMSAPIHLTLHRNGTVSVMNHTYAKPGDSAYTVVVLNNQSRPLPSTGGSGTMPFTLLGLLLMAGAVSGAWLCLGKRLPCVKGGGAPKARRRD